MSVQFTYSACNSIRKISYDTKAATLMTLTFNTGGIIGAGPIGAGIAQVAAQSRKVTLSYRTAFTAKSLFHLG